MNLFPFMQVSAARVCLIHGYRFYWVMVLFSHLHDHSSLICDVDFDKLHH